jgi:hypothetical protein
VIDVYKQEMIQSRPKVKPLLRPTGGYAYHRSNAMELAMLIFQDLEECPNEIDTNKIFSSVRKIYQECKPQKKYDRDVVLLFSICASSGWFTPRQRQNMEEWLTETVAAVKTRGS